MDLAVGQNTPDASEHNSTTCDHVRQHSIANHPRYEGNDGISLNRSVPIGRWMALTGFAVFFGIFALGFRLQVAGSVSELVSSR